MNFFDHKGLGNHLLQLCPKVVKHPVYRHFPDPVPLTFKLLKCAENMSKVIHS